MEFKTTARGFAYYEFKDFYGETCSLQKSSLATEDCIWLGLDKPDIQEFFNAPLLKGMTSKWLKINPEDLKHAPENTMHIFSRMHLSREQVKKLLPILQRFVDTGEIEED